MKKAISFALVIMLVLSATSFAAKNPSYAIDPYAVESPSSNGAAIGLGIDNGFTSLKFSSPDWAGSIGLGLTGSSGNTVIGAGGKFAFNLTRGEFPTHLGAAIQYAGVTNASAVQVAILYGAETILAGKLNIGFDIYPVSFTSTTILGTTSTSYSLGGGTVYCYVMF